MCKKVDPNEGIKSTVGIATGVALVVGGGIAILSSVIGSDDKKEINAALRKKAKDLVINLLK